MFIGFSPVYVSPFLRVTGMAHCLLNKCIAGIETTSMQPHACMHELITYLSLFLSILCIESITASAYLIINTGLALQGKTFVEGNGRFFWTIMDCWNYSYGKLKAFLGPSPIFQTLLPLISTSCCRPGWKSTLGVWNFGNPEGLDEGDVKSIAASHSSGKISESFKRDCKLIYAVE